MRGLGKFGAAALFAVIGTGLAVAGPPITLRFSVWDGDVSLNIIRGVLKQFEAEHPGITVKLESIPDYTFYHQKMLTEYAAHVAPDVAMMDPGHFQALATRGALLNLNDYIKSTPGFDIGSYYKPIVDAHSLDGKVYVLPRDIAPTGLIYYNKKAFDEAHLHYPDGTWTWDFKERPELKEKDFLWVMHRLTKYGPDGGKPTQYGFCPAQPSTLSDTLIYCYGLHQADSDTHPTKVTYDSADMAKIYGLIVSLAYDKDKRWIPSNVEVTNVLQQGTEALFVKGTCAMFQNGIWEVPNIRRDMKPGSKDFFDWDIAQFPAYADGRKGFATGGSGYCIFSSTAHPKEAWDLTRYMAGPVGMAAMARAGIAQPAIRSVALSDAWLPGPNTPLEQRWPHNRLLTDQEVNFVHFGPTAEYWPEVNGLFTPQQDSIFNDLTPVKEGLAKGTADAQHRLDALLQEEVLPTFNWSFGIVVGALIVAAVLAAVYWPERGIRYTHREKRESIAGYKFVSPWLIGLTFFSLGPMILSLIMSFLNWDMITPARWRGLHNYSEAFVEDSRFWVSMKVTAIFTLVSTPVGILIALCLALLLNQKVRGVPIFRAIFYIPTIASVVAMTLVGRKLLSPDDGLVNTIIYSPFINKTLHLGDLMNSISGTKTGDHVNWLGNEHTAMASVILLSLLGVGGSMVILLAGLQGVPQYYYEAATVDGANPWHRLKNITLPLLTPSIFFTMVTGFIGSFQVFTQVYIITGGANGGPNNSLLVYMISIWSAAFTTLRMGYAAALAWGLFAVILLFTLIQFKASKWVYYEADIK